MTCCLISFFLSTLDIQDIWIINQFHSVIVGTCDASYAVALPGEGVLARVIYSGPFGRTEWSRF